VPRVIIPIGQAYLSRRYAILFYTLVFTIVASPVTAALGLSGNLIEFLLAISLVAAVTSVTSERTRNVLLAIVIALWLAHHTAAWTGHPTLSRLILSSWTIVGLLAAAASLRYAMRGAKVDAEHLYAALSSYLLAGVYFGLLYWVLEEIQPGSIVATSFSRTAAIYYSFVTLATIGYGDIVPKTDVARGFAVLEGVGGQLFLAVLVARLMTLYQGSKGD
jgi:hypothetical protein